MATRLAETVTVDSELERLELPGLSALSLLRHFGPGMILMMTGIGTSHLVTAPDAGGRFAYALLWCVPIAYSFKYYGFTGHFGRCGLLQLLSEQEHDYRRGRDARHRS